MNCYLKKHIGTSIPGFSHSILSGMAVSITHSETLLSDHFENVILKCLFLGYSNARIDVILSVILIEKRVPLKSEHVSILSCKTFDDVDGMQKLMIPPTYLHCPIDPEGGEGGGEGGNDRKYSSRSL
jgi:hypothetical protein